MCPPVSPPDFSPSTSALSNPRSAAALSVSALPSAPPCPSWILGYPDPFPPAPLASLSACCNPEVLAPNLVSYAPLQDAIVHFQGVTSQPPAQSEACVPVALNQRQHASFSVFVMPVGCGHCGRQKKARRERTEGESVNGGRAGSCRHPCPAPCLSEAAYTLLLYDELLEWSDRPLREFLTYPMQTEWQRKEHLHLAIIQNFDRGKVGGLSPRAVVGVTSPFPLVLGAHLPTQGLQCALETPQVTMQVS